MCVWLFLCFHVVISSAENANVLRVPGINGNVVIVAKYKRRNAVPRIPEQGYVNIRTLWLTMKMCDEAYNEIML